MQSKGTLYSLKAVGYLGQYLGVKCFRLWFRRLYNIWIYHLEYNES
jgi:hypothetical protein